MHYRGTKQEKYGYKFDSSDEVRFFEYITQNKDKLGIKEIEVQKKYILQQSFKNKDNKCIRAITYTADFVLTGEDDSITIVDIKPIKKSLIDEVFKIKFKLLRYIYPNYNYKVIAWDKTKKEFVEI